MPKLLIKKFILYLLCLALFISCENPSQSDNLSVDIIIEADHILTMNESLQIYENSAIAINKGKILDIDSAEVINQKYQSNNRISGKNRILMPGLINGHSHAAMTLLRGIADDKSLIDWLNNYIFPLEQEFVSEEFVRIGTKLACWEMIRGGTTTFVDMYFYSEVIAEVAASRVTERGTRADDRRSESAMEDRKKQGYF